MPLEQYFEKPIEPSEGSPEYLRKPGRANFESFMYPTPFRARTVLDRQQCLLVAIHAFALDPCYPAVKCHREACQG